MISCQKNSLDKCAISFCGEKKCKSSIFKKRAGLEKKCALQERSISFLHIQQFPTSTSVEGLSAC